MSINETPPGKLRDYLIGDLGVARRHLERIKTRLMMPVPGVLDEISRSIEDCIERIQRDIPEGGPTCQCCKPE